MVEVIIPVDLWDEDEDGVLLGWLYASGDRVAQGDVIAEVTYSKSQFDICASGDGVLRHRVEEEALIRRGCTIATIE